MALREETPTSHLPFISQTKPINSLPHYTFTPYILMPSHLTKKKLFNKLQVECTFFEGGERGGGGLKSKPVLKRGTPVFLPEEQIRDFLLDH